MREDPEASAAREAIAATLNAHTAGIGFENQGSPVLSEWLVLTCITDLDSGNSCIAGISSKNLLAHHRQGLLHEALYGGWWTEDIDDEDA